LFKDEVMELVIENYEVTNFGDRLWLYLDAKTEELYLTASGK
jgi:hypothetical protein